MMATLSMSTRALRIPTELLEDIVMRMIPIAVQEDTAMEDLTERLEIFQKESMAELA